jgi:hypothetical protein
LIFLGGRWASYDFYNVAPSHLVNKFSLYCKNRVLFTLFAS